WGGFGGRWTAGLDGTYIDSHRSRVFDTQPWTEYAGQWNSRDLFVRWKHQLYVGYDTGPWSTVLYQNYVRGYQDEKPLGVVPAGWSAVDDYMTYSLAVAYTGFKNVTIRGGIRNLLNEDPPFTAHNLDFAAGAGWDPRV